jgi:hypothetical protein
MGLFDVITFPVRVAIAFGEASIGVAKLVDPDGPLRMANQVSTMTAADQPLGRAMAPGGVLDRLLAEDGIVARLSTPGGPLDRLMEPGGAVDRVTAPGGPLERLLSDDGALERVLAKGGVLDQLLAEQGLIQQLVEDGGIIERVTDSLERIARIGPVIESLDRPIKAVDESAQLLSVAVEPLRDFAMRMPGMKRRPAPRTVRSERDIAEAADVAEIIDADTVD